MFKTVEVIILQFLRHFLKVLSVSYCLTDCGRLFHRVGAEYENAPQ